MDDWTGVLRSVIELSTQERDLRTLVRRAAALVAGTAAADACFVHVVDLDAGDLVLAGATPDRFDALAGTIRLRLGEGVAGWVAEQGEAAVVEDKWSDERYVYIPALRGEDFASMVSVPLRRPEGLVVGVLNVHAHAPDRFGPEAVRRLTETAGLLAGIVENAVLWDRLARREHDLEDLAARSIELQELDRRRIAGDIHDGISQRLISAHYHLSAARSLAGPGVVADELATTAVLLGDALEEARRAIVGLRPAVLDDLGLAVGVASLAGTLAPEIGVTLDVDLADATLAPHVETALYRIVQEALQNVAKHARAASVSISLRPVDGTVRLVIADDGVGFDGAAPRRPMSFGLAGVAERVALLGAHLDVDARMGEGTRISVTVPLDGTGRA